jgi:hypothetical protein
VDRFYLILSILLVLIFVGYFGFFYTINVPTPPNQSRVYLSPSPTPTPTPTIAGGKISVEGTIQCLPHNNLANPSDCVLGLRIKTGKYYSLNNLPQKDIISSKIFIGTKVKIVGSLIEIGSTDPNILGRIKVLEIK